MAGSVWWVSLTYGLGGAVEEREETAGPAGLEEEGEEEEEDTLQEEGQQVPPDTGLRKRQVITDHKYRAQSPQCLHLALATCRHKH